MILGSDVSFYQDNPETPRGIDFHAMRSAGVQFTIIRAGQNVWKDRDFARNWKVSKGILPRGSYWFYDSRVDPKRQAALWVTLLAEAGDSGELPLWCDFEERYGGLWKGWREWTVFIKEIQRLMPRKEIGIYTAYYYWMENTVAVGIPSASLEYFKQFPLWVANYGVVKPLIPRPWNTWTFWQYTESAPGDKYGVESGSIDLNWFDGTVEDLYRRFEISNLEDPPKDEEEKELMYKVTVVWEDGASEKKNPNTGGSAIKVWKKGETFDAVALVPDSLDPNNSQKLWARLGNGNHVAVLYPSSARGNERCTWEEVGSEPPPPGEKPVLSITIRSAGYKNATVDLEPDGN